MENLTDRLKILTSSCYVALLGGLGTAMATDPATQDRTTLPIPEPQYPHSTVLDVRDATPPPHFEVKAPEGAPNVLIVLVDDLGFAGTSTYGGPISTPTFDRLAKQGLIYNNFHTTAVSSPTRAAIKSGRNHHNNNMGGIIETGTSFPGNTGQIPQDVTPLAEMLRLNGYSTAAFGKWHETAAWEASVAGPFDRWPTHQGFDKFYGFDACQIIHCTSEVYLFYGHDHIDWVKVFFASETSGQIGFRVCCRNKFRTNGAQEAKMAFRLFYRKFEKFIDQKVDRDFVSESSKHFRWKELFHIAILTAD